MRTVFVVDDAGPAGPPEATLARRVAAALEAAGIEVAKPVHALDPGASAETLRMRFEDAPPQLWVSVGSSAEHPDRLGPAVCAALDIPYVVFEPEPALTAGGELRAAEEHGESLAQANAVITLSTLRFGLLEEWLPDPTRLTKLAPWVDATPFFEAARLRDQYRASLASRLQLPGNSRWLLADGPMDSGGALESFQVLARALSRLPMLAWNFIIAGDGPQSGEVEAMFRSLPVARLRRWPGAAPGDRPALYCACDLFLWPAMRDVGVDALLDAQAAGLPVVACASPEVHERVRNGATGRVVAAGNAESFANVIGFLLRHPQFLSSYREEARRIIGAEHDLWVVGRALAAVLEQVVARHASASR